MSEAGTDEMTTRRIAFLTTNDFGFGGSEDLWTATATELLRQGHTIAASVRRWSPLPALLTDLQTLGSQMLWHDVPPTGDDFADLLDFNPDFVVVSQGYQLEGVDWLAGLARCRVPFIILNQCVHEAGWPSANDDILNHIVSLHEQAREYCFVSDANRRLHERFFGRPCSRAAVVRNPFKVRYGVSVGWPEDSPLRLATVGRLELFHKGYDLLLEALGDSRWVDRNWQLHIYGGGPHRALLERLVSAAIASRVFFHGHTSDIEGVWRENHVLIQPSRLEGMPLSVVEAMLCARPIVASDVAGHSEWITDGVNGFLAAAATVRHLSEALEAMWTSRARLQSMGRAARTTAQQLTPPNPAKVFAQRVLDHAAEAVGTGAVDRMRRATARTSVPPTHTAEDHLAHLYYSHGGGFSEETKVATPYPRGVVVRLTFNGLRGRIRLDPSTREGRFRVIRAILTRLENGQVVFDLAREKVATAWRVEGTARLLESSTETGVLVESTGDDPILQLTAWPGDESTFVKLEVEIAAD